jgi:hypothetical protein
MNVIYEQDSFSPGFFLNTFGTNLMDMRWLELMGSSKKLELSCNTPDVEKRIKSYLQAREHERNIHIHRRPGMMSLIDYKERSNPDEHGKVEAVVRDIEAFLENAANLGLLQRHSTFDV